MLMCGMVKSGFERSPKRQCGSIRTTQLRDGHLLKPNTGASGWYEKGAKTTRTFWADASITDYLILRRLASLQGGYHVFRKDAVEMTNAQLSCLLIVTSPSSMDA